MYIYISNPIHIHVDINCICIYFIYMAMMFLFVTHKCIQNHFSAHKSKNPQNTKLPKHIKMDYTIYT